MEVDIDLVMDHLAGDLASTLGSPLELELGQSQGQSLRSSRNIQGQGGGGGEASRTGGPVTVGSAESPSPSSMIFKARRSRSTSNLNTNSTAQEGSNPKAVGHKSESDDTSKEVDSDEAQRSLANLSIQGRFGPVGLGRFARTTTQRLSLPGGGGVPLPPLNVVESDSTELFGVAGAHKVSQSGKRRRRHKRMAVDVSDDNFPEPLTTKLSSESNVSSRDPVNIRGSLIASGAAAGSSSTTPSAGLMGQRKGVGRKKTSSSNSSGEKAQGQAQLVSDPKLDLLKLNSEVGGTGKRKRTLREKPSHTSMIDFGIPSAPTDHGRDRGRMTSNIPVASVLPVPLEFMDASTPFTGNPVDLLAMGMAIVDDEDMKSEGEEDKSSLSSSDESEWVAPSCDEGQEGDDEHSDWVGDDYDSIDEPRIDYERRRDLIMRRLRECAPSREIRAGKRNFHPGKPVFSIRTSANEQLSKFLQDPEQSEIKLHPMRKEERNQLAHLATLYSLKMHIPPAEGEGSVLSCPVLTKTAKTTQMDVRCLELSGSLLSEGISPPRTVPSTGDPLQQLESESDTKRLKM